MLVFDYLKLKQARKRLYNLIFEEADENLNNKVLHHFHTGETKTAMSEYKNKSGTLETK